MLLKVMILTSGVVGLGEEVAQRKQEVELVAPRYSLQERFYRKSLKLHSCQHGSHS